MPVNEIKYSTLAVDSLIEEFNSNKGRDSVPVKNDDGDVIGNVVELKKKGKSVIATLNIFPGNTLYARIS